MNGTLLAIRHQLRRGASVHRRFWGNGRGKRNALNKQEEEASMYVAQRRISGYGLLTYHLQRP